MLDLRSDRLSLSLHEPGDGFYCGTRFDRSGVFASLLFQGVEMAGAWYSRYDPFMHDAVKGPAEEFSPIGFDGDDGTFLKIGVGLLRRPDDGKPYDRFRLYEIVDPGVWTFGTEGEREAWFRHEMRGTYCYEKRVCLLDDGGFTISHKLRSEGPLLEGEVYNHNFFTFGCFAVGPSREIDFPFRPDGSWRSVYDSVGFTPSGVRFSRALQEGESVYSGDIHEAGSAGMPYDLTLRETAAASGCHLERSLPDCHLERSREISPCASLSRDDNAPLTVRISGDVPVTRTVLWANHRIACLEPYNAFRAAPSAPFRWSIRYRFD